MIYLRDTPDFQKKCVICNKKYKALFIHQKACSLLCKKENDRLYQRERHKAKKEGSKIKVIPVIKKKGPTNCQLCKRSDLDLKHHYIIQISEAPKHENLNHPKNIIMLCTLCRRSMNIHKDEKRKKLVETRGLKQLFPNYIFC